MKVILHLVARCGKDGFVVFDGHDFEDQLVNPWIHGPQDGLRATRTFAEMEHDHRRPLLGLREDLRHLGNK